MKKTYIIYSVSLLAGLIATGISLHYYLDAYTNASLSIQSSAVHEITIRAYWSGITILLLFLIATLAIALAIIKNNKARNWFNLVLFLVALAPLSFFIYSAVVSYSNMTLSYKIQKVTKSLENHGNVDVDFTRQWMYPKFSGTPEWPYQDLPIYIKTPTK